VLQRRVHADDLRVRLGVEQAGEPIDTVTADAAAVPSRRTRAGLDEVDSDRQVERLQPLLLQVVAEPLDPRFVLDRGEPVRCAARPLGGVLSAAAVDAVEVLGLGVVRLEVGVADRPGRRQAAVVTNLAEVLRPQAEQRRTVELGVAPT
jgi:hypothetical protein